MLQDVYFMNKETGELKPSGEAIREFYKTHGALDRWTDEWQETALPVDGAYIEPPDFRRAVGTR